MAGRKLEDFKEEISLDPKNTMVTYEIELDMDRYHILLLAEQKHLLLTIMNKIGLLDCEAGLEGIINLIDSIQDDLEEQGVPEKIVFPFLNDYCEAPDYFTLSYRDALQALPKAAHKDLPKYLNLDPELDKALNKYFKDGEV